MSLKRSVYFQRKMSLKTAILGSSENDFEIAQPTFTDSGGDSFVSERAPLPLILNPQARKEAYRWVRDSLRQFRYTSLGRADRGAVRNYLQKVTGRSRAQVTRLIRQYRDHGRIRDRRGPPAKPFTPALYRGRRDRAGEDGCAARHPLGPSDPQAVSTGLSSLP